MTCPCCRDLTGRSALWWSKAGHTAQLCDFHKEDARAERRLRAEFARTRREMFTVVRMDERR